MTSHIPRDLIPHLDTQFARALPVLFTGAGFSLGAQSSSRGSIPSYDELRDLLYEINFGEARADDESSLQDLFEHARLRHGRQLAELLVRELSVDADGLPDWYQALFSMPWHRAYTLNVDDIEEAVSRRWDLPRPVASTSALLEGALEADATARADRLDVIHLNGRAADGPDAVTFSVTQYAERLARPDPWYARFAADLLSRPCVFMGTRLDEPPLWQHIELRRTRGGRNVRELRPRSYLVTPRLDRARRSLLAEYNVEWVSMSAQEFAEEVLPQLASGRDSGTALLSQRAASTRRRPVLPLVTDLPRDPAQQSGYLLGAEPLWDDIEAGRAVLRESDEELWRRAMQMHAARGAVRGVLSVVGTAASGKSTALMRLALRATAEGHSVGWLDQYSDLPPSQLRTAMAADEGPEILCIDDADLYGSQLAPTLRDICLGDRAPLVIVGIRSGRVDRALNPSRLEGIPTKEFATPPLADSDIGRLLDALDANNRLGQLRSLSRSDQERVFREQAGRHLLVAMIQATSGRRFEEKIHDELTDLDSSSRLIYAVAAVATTFRFSLSADEVLLATGLRTNEALNALRTLISRHLLISRGGNDALRVRHRVVAEVLTDELARAGQLGDVLRGLALLAATKVGPSLSRSARPWRFLRSIINHDFLNRTLRVEQARNLYGELEQLLAWDAHYWLQRGSLEVESGDLRLAENFLGQARSLQPDFWMIETEWAYLQFRQAVADPISVGAPEQVSEATKTLLDLIAQRGSADAYPYHVLGSQGLAWARRGIAGTTERGRYLQQLIRTVEQGVSRHPRMLELEQLLGDLKQELMQQAVARASADAPDSRASGDGKPE